jgi:hypothetical protein
LLTATSLAWVPGRIFTSTLNLGGSERSNFTRIAKPTVAIKNKHALKKENIFAHELYFESIRTENSI